jgi:hypothetical protein
MKKFFRSLFILIFLFASCIGQKSRVIFHPGSTQETKQEDSREIWEIIESQNGGPDAAVPEWVSLYLGGKVNEIESLPEFNGKYIFIGENRSENLNVLMQWVKGFAVVQDLPRLIVQRVEQKYITSASLYPDDEYGEYFLGMITKVSDGEFPGAVKEQTFWVKRRMIPVEAEDGDDLPPPETPLVTERYEYFIMISIDKEALQRQIRNIMAEVRTAVTVTREQSAAINRVQNTFFEGL